MNISQQDDFRDISQIEALAILDGKSNNKTRQYSKPVEYKSQNNNSWGLKKELMELRSTMGQRNEKIKKLNADKIALQNQVKALESRLAYFEQFKIKARHQVGTDEFLKIIEQVGK